MSASQAQANREAPETTSPQRNANGRFAKGNRGGPGNPFGRKLAHFRQRLLHAVTDDTIDRVGQLLVEKALAGDMAAIKMLLQYAVGKPQVVAEPDRVDIEEWELFRERMAPADKMNETLAGVPISVGIATVPSLTEVNERQFVDMMLHPEKYNEDAFYEPTQEELDEELKVQREFRAAEAAEQVTAARRDAEATVAERVSVPSPSAETKAPKVANGLETRPTAGGGSATPQKAVGVSVAGRAEGVGAPSTNAANGKRNHCPGGSDEMQRSRSRTAG